MGPAGSSPEGLVGGRPVAHTLGAPWEHRAKLALLTKSSTNCLRKMGAQRKMSQS